MSHSSSTTGNNSNNLLEALQAQANQQQQHQLPNQNALNTMTERQFNASLDALAQGQIGGGCSDSSNNLNNNNNNDNSNLQQLAQIPTPDNLQQQQPSVQYYQAIAAALTHSGLAAANFANANFLSLGNSNLNNSNSSSSSTTNNNLNGNNINANGYNGIILPPSQLPTGPLSFPGISNLKNDNGNSNSNHASKTHPNNNAFKVSFSQSSMDMGEDMSEASKPSHTSSRKRFRNSFLSACAVSEDEGDREKRRKERNVREQQRSQQITGQIERLRDILSEAKVSFKPDKFSTLATTGTFIQQLQERSTMLDQEHKKLLDTIVKTTEIVNNQYVSVSQPQEPITTTPSSSSPDVGSVDALHDFFADRSNSPLADESAVFVSGLDYKSIFAFCPVACAVTSIDGRFLDCNRDFEEISGFSKADLIAANTAPSSTSDSAEATSSEGGKETVASTQPVHAPKRLSLFNILQRSDMERVFSSMSFMLKKPFGKAAESSGHDMDNGDYFSDAVGMSRKPNDRLTLNVALVRSQQGRPKFFTCTVVPRPPTPDVRVSSDIGSTGDAQVDYEDLFSA